MTARMKTIKFFVVTNQTLEDIFSKEFGLQCKYVNLNYFASMKLAKPNLYFCLVI